MEIKSDHGPWERTDESTLVNEPSNEDTRTQPESPSSQVYGDYTESKIVT